MNSCAQSTWHTSWHSSAGSCSRFDNMPYTARRPIKGLTARNARRPSNLLPCLVGLEHKAQRKEVAWLRWQGQCPVVDTQSWEQTSLHSPVLLGTLFPGFLVPFPRVPGPCSCPVLPKPPALPGQGNLCALSALSPHGPCVPPNPEVCPLEFSDEPLLNSKYLPAS